ncbi:S25 ribosomal, putative [Entamoeba histolytica HM-1:IMSS-B]|uniref:40S ribosomal protein S25 n=6 Tax=Entamoeba histolytica TaxID=5759 RepID=C4LY50_ENTH1|nr:40S ribosomal protein S25, putative [Entamoeba histolytica HM-1:IMSS]EMD46882.1 S25 ribosomal protein [Entamoeba histolytica KU27]EMH75739.1 S25 ribosomal, putative [Entamoeba histolytica HM-1:IMSS-B]ENY65161.1 S25 ribosomal protein, putative [Entamoeba histolytica HM-1:IMSS-A]GAT93704.1 ribosomal protein s25 putative [Entamoeba histolytica]EAL50531.1 40S ribosomal protein S25, putative [Entamoeba histolytica HM-1:IMSS]|eukprot:XP_655917.1 40S ribosomal protein S25, putative [Entamoeba histolytica HM-1:IMSS]
MPPKDAKGKGAAAGKKGALTKPKKSSGGKAPKKSWSKTKVKEKLNNAVLFDKATLDKCTKEVPSMKVITPAVVADRMKITCSLAKILLKDLEKKELIVPVKVDNHIWIYTRSAKHAAAAPAEAEKKPAKGSKKQVKA